MKKPPVDAGGFVRCSPDLENLPSGIGMVRLLVRTVNRDIVMPKCSECGFLSLRRGDNFALDEAHRAFRQAGKVASSGNRYMHERVPECFMDVIPMVSLIGDKSAVSEVKEFIEANRECSAFTEWEQGFSPKEHAEMMYSKKLLESEHAWREKQAGLERTWREQDQDRDRKWRNEDRHSLWVNMFVTVAVALLGAVVGLVAGNKLAWDKSLAEQANAAATAPAKP